MTDEEKKVDEKKVCKCGELGSFFTQVAAIFLGVLLAILVSAALLKPKAPCFKGMPMGMPGIERQVPPYGQWQIPHQNGKYRGPHHLKHKGFHKGKFKSHGENFRPPVAPEQKSDK